jgi:hypothetical protein
LKVVGLRDAASDNLPFKVLHVMTMMMMMMVKRPSRRATQTSTRGALRNGCSCQSQPENEYHACKRSHLRFL